MLRRSHEAATKCSCSVSSKTRRRRCRSRRPSLKTKKNNNSCLFFLLPVEIAADIFSRLPFHSVLQCKLVCKTWRDLLNNNNNNNNSIVDQKAAVGFLLRIHFKEPGFYYGEYDEKQQQLVPTYNFNLTKKAIFNHQYPFKKIWNWYVVGSCNGLICLRRQNEPVICSCDHGTDRHDMYVCNPYTGEYAKLPNPNPRLLDHLIPRYEDGLSYGFGYHPITKEYKVIRIFYQRDFISAPHAQVYTLGSDTSAWRSIGEIKHKLYRSFQWGNESDNTSWGILLNGVLYWLTENAEQIFLFDLADEKFRDFSPTPTFLGPSVLGVLNGCLCFSAGWNESTRIWVMNTNDYSWSKKFSISWWNGFRPYFPLAHLESVLYRTCPDDWVVAQKLMVSGCDPVPRRKCFSRAPPRYSKPLPINSSLWTLPGDSNILWTNYKCKDYSCLVSKQTIGRRGFFKCADCFDFNKRGWEIPANESSSAEFTVDQVLGLKPGEIRIGLDFSPTTGSFAAIMRERNITIASATLNLGAPFSEVIALRGLLPLYISIGSRLPFFDNTLDIIHSTLFLDGWIGLKLYLEEFSKLGYKRLLWRVVPKTDKAGDELFFSAVLEKPLRV